MTEQIIIEFVSDPSGLQPTEDKLAALGKVDQQAANAFKQTNTELKKRETLITGNVAEANKLKTSYDGLRNAVLKESQVMKLSAEEFKRTGKTLEQLVNEMKGATAETKKNADETVKSTTATKTLRSELRQITEQLTRLKLEGKDNTAQFQQLTAQAGKLKDAMGDVNRQVSVLASDTTTFDGLISGAQGVAGAFAVAQGASALFGDSSEELQETLLRVNAAMAILQGLQQVGNILQKESAASRLIDVIATKAQIAAQTAFNFVVGASTGILKAFRIALAATGVGLLIIGLIELVSILNQSRQSMEEFNNELERNKRLMEADIKAVNDRTELELASARARGAKESELIKIKGKGILQNIKAIDEENKLSVKQRDALDSTTEKWAALNQSISDNIDTRKDLAREAKILEQDLKGAVVDEAKDANEKSIQLAKERNAKEKEFRLKALEDIKAGIELQLLEVAKGSQAEIDLKKKLSIAELNIGLENEKLTANQRKLLIQQSFQERLKLEKDFSAEVKKISLENLQSHLNAELQEIDISNQRKEDLTVQLLEVQRQLELAAVLGNKQKEKEINAKFDKEISDQAVAIRKAALDEELRLLEAQAGAKKRALEKQTGSTTPGGIPIDIKTRIDAINILLKYEQNNIEKRKELNDSLHKDGLISNKEFQLTTALLADEEAKAVEDAEARKRAAYKETDERRMQNAFELTRQTLDTLSTLYDFVSARETVALETQRQRIKDLQDAGAISEKEAKERNKRLDIEERKIKQQQAQRNKAIEVFNALLSIPAAYLKGLKDGGPILAALYAGLAGANAALIAARPIPKFGRGKKNMYEGIGQVGETGPELIEKGGKYYYAEKPQIVWLAKSDKVYNPKETIDMINKPLPSIDKRIMNFSSSNSSKLNIDYQKLGKAVGENIPQVGFNFDEDGFTQYQKDKESFTRYLNKRRSF